MYKGDSRTSTIDFCGDFFMDTDPNITERPHSWVKDIEKDDKVHGCYLVKGKRLGTTRKGSLFISLILSDRTGQVDAKVWDDASTLSSIFNEGDIVDVEGIVEVYQGRLQVNISRLARANESETDWGIFLESSPVDPTEMMASLRTILKGVKNIHLRALNETFLGDPDFMFQFKRAPSAKNFHHNYMGGLLEHTLNVCRMAMEVSRLYPHLDGDLLLTAAFLHDIGKIRELDLDFKIDYTDEGRLIGHVVMSMAMVEERLQGLKGVPLDLATRLKHMILSHHGEYAFGSPKRPKILEAFALHIIDDLDAKLNGLARFMDRDQRDGPWTDFNRLFDRYLLKGEIRPVEMEKKEDRPGGMDGSQCAFPFTSDDG